MNKNPETKFITFQDESAKKQELEPPISERVSNHY